MILTCPECATSYYVDDGRIPPGGRSVRCSSCGARWKTGVEPAPPESPEPDELEAALADTEAAEVAAPAPALAPPPAAEPEPVAAAPEEDLEISGPKARPAAAPPEPRKTPRAIIAWSAMAATVAALVAAAIVFRSDVVRLLPQSSGVYAAIGLPVNSLGLVIEQVKADPTFQGGRPVLSVTGSIHNVGTHAADAPALRIDLLNKAGAPVAAKVARPLDPRIPAGARRHFAISIIDPPSTARDLQVAFEGAAKGGPTHAAEAVLAPGLAPVEAKPLPLGAPEALPDHG